MSEKDNVETEETPEETPEETQIENEEVAEEEKSKLATDIEIMKAKKESLEADIVEARRLRREAKEKDFIGKDEEDEQVDTTPQENKADDIDVKISQQVERTLLEREKKVARANKAQALKDFLESNSILKPENDPTGIYFDAWMSKYDRLNTEDRNSYKEITEDLTDALKLLNLQSKSDNDNSGQDFIDSQATTPKTSSKKKGESEKISEQDKKIAEQFGLDPETFVKHDNRSWEEGI